MVTMPARQPRPDDAQPMPQRQSGGGGDDDVYVVDVRGRKRSPGLSKTRAMPVGDYGGHGRGGGSDLPPEPGSGPGRARRGGPHPGPPPPRRRRRRGHWGKVVALVVVLWLAFMVGTPLHAWSTVTKVDTAPAGQRPPETPGHTYLLVGSDSREGLTAEQRAEYTTGDAAGRRTDSIILVHVPEGSGKPVMVSIPRDSFVPVPGHDSNKINAAFALGGPNLLVQTVEQVTDLRLDGYVEIGFAGFANVVNSVGGVDICVPFDMDDPKAGINLTKGCQTLDGRNALGFVRARYSDPRGDIGRAERQRQFLAAIMKKAATPSTALIPTRYWGFTHASAEGLIVGEDTSMRDASRVLLAMRAVSNDEGLSLVVPIQSMSYPTSAGSAVKWDTERAKALFTALRNDEPLEAPPAGTDGKPSGG